MTISEFINATNRLEIYYGKEYEKNQLSIMHEELQDFEIDRYKQLVSLAIKECKFLPKVADIIKLDKEKPYTNEQEEKEKIECKKCNSTGCIMYNKKIDGINYQFAAVCNCGNAKQYKGWEIPDKSHRSNYYTPLASELGLV